MSKPISFQRLYDDKHASFSVKEMFELLFDKHYRNFQLIFPINKKTVMNYTTVTNSCLFKLVF
jgi:hypothetical protein